MSDISDRINQKMHELGLKHKDVVLATDASKGTVSNWLNGLNIPTGLRLIKLAKLLKTSEEWIISGGSTSNQSQSLGGMSQSQSQGLQSKDDDLRQIPVLDCVQAGGWANIEYDGANILSYTRTDYKGSEPSQVFALCVRGLSMSPQFMPEDIIVVDPNRRPTPGNYVVAVKDDEEATFKKYRVTSSSFGADEYDLVPLNPDFPILRSADNNIKVIGVVVRHVAKLVD
jgi:SOS-response transcriptional repressor LexA